VLDPHHVSRSREHDEVANGVDNCGAPSIRSLNFSPKAQIRFGPGHNQVDGAAKWSYFYLYVIIDIFSRRIVAWCIADAESATLFKPCSTTPSSSIMSPPPTHPACRPRRPMKAKATALLLADLGVTNRIAGLHFERQPFLGKPLQDLKISPQFPQRFGCIEDAKTSAAASSIGIIRITTMVASA